MLESYVRLLARPTTGMRVVGGEDSQGCPITTLPLSCQDGVKLRRGGVLAAELVVKRNRHALRLPFELAGWRWESS